MKEFTDTEMLNWIERQTNRNWWLARQSSTGRGFRLHNLGTGEYSNNARGTAREAITHAMNKELDGLSELQQ